MYRTIVRTGLSRRTRVVASLAAFSLMAACGSDGPGGPVPQPVPAALTIDAGDDQNAVVATRTAVQPAVRLVDLHGAGVPDVPVTFTVATGDGWVPRTSVATDADGIAATDWYLGAAPGVHSLTATAAGFSVELTATATPLVPGATYSGASSYVELIAGDLPLIISAPHGGTLEPLSIPDRNDEGATIVRDAETDQLALAMTDAFESQAAGTPHIVIMHLHRSKVDANRDIDEATEGNAAAERAWREYHGFIDAARQFVAAEHGVGFYIDLHGHGHEIPRLELGYLLTGSQLAGDDASLNAPSVVDRSSIRRLAATADATHAELLRGDVSLGTLLENSGYSAVPSSSQPDPGGEPYFTGGYSTERHGSRNGGVIDAVQIEANRIGVRDTGANRQAFAAALAQVMQMFFAAHYDIPLAAGAPAL